LKSDTPDRSIKQKVIKHPENPTTRIASNKHLVPTMETKQEVNVLFICTANQERSPTAEHVFNDVPGWNVKSAGTASYATTRVSKELLGWADKIYVMEQQHYSEIRKISSDCFSKTRVLGIEDQYQTNSARLVVTLLSKITQIEPLDDWLHLKFNLESY
jgi:predicted protein tyrosine phosphatase